ncbi:hypothetical protein FRB96_000731 [Tulasnella sp. 330]|nr:hypothetical protein FRB96_000731 [Tulasnella sp. 330]KAG8879937.1 hypothetical protein FRB97_001291 [Tulasnella sp. 331]
MASLPPKCLSHLPVPSTQLLRFLRSQLSLISPHESGLKKRQFSSRRSSCAPAAATAPVAMLKEDEQLAASHRETQVPIVPWPNFPSKNHESMMQPLQRRDNWRSGNSRGLFPDGHSHWSMEAEGSARRPLKPPNEFRHHSEGRTGQRGIRLDPDGSLATLLESGIVDRALQDSPRHTSTTRISLEELEALAVDHLQTRKFKEMSRVIDTFIMSGGDPQITLDKIMAVAWNLHLVATDYWSVYAVTFKLRMALTEATTMTDHVGTSAVGGEDRSKRAYLFASTNTRELLLKMRDLVQQSPSFADDTLINNQILYLYSAFGMTREAYGLLKSLAKRRVPVSERSYCSVAQRLLRQRQWILLPLLFKLAKTHLGLTIPHLLDAKTLAYIQLRDYTALKLIPDEYASGRLTPKPTTLDAVIRCHLENSDVPTAKEVMGRMTELGLEPTQKTMVAVLEGSLKLGLTEEVRSMIEIAIASSNSNAAALNAGLKLYGNEDAREAMDRLLKHLNFTQQQGGGGETEVNECVRPTARTLAILIDGHARRRELTRAVQVFGSAESLGITHPSIAMTTAMIKAHVAADDLPGALFLIEQLCLGHGRYDEVIMGPLLLSMKEMAALDRPKRPRGAGAPYPPLSASSCDWRQLRLDPNHFSHVLDATQYRHGLDFVVLIVKLMQALGIPTTSPSVINTLLRYTRGADPATLRQISKTLVRGSGPEAGTHLINTVLARVIRKESAQTLPKFDLKRSPPFCTPKPPTSALIPSLHNDIQTSLSAGINYSTEYVPHVYKGLRPQIRELHRRGVQPDRESYALRIRREAVNRGNLLEARVVFDTMVSRGMKPQQHHYAALMEGHARHGDMDEAQRLMWEYESSNPSPLPSPLMPSTSWGDQGQAWENGGYQHDEQPRFVRSMTSLKRTVGHVLLWTILIYGFGRIARPDQARATMDEMIRSGVKPDLVAIDALTNAYARNNQHSQARKAIFDFWPLERVGPLTEELKKLPLKKLLRAMWKLEDEKSDAGGTRWRGFTKKEGLELKEGLERVVTLIKGGDAISDRNDAISRSDGMQIERIKRPHGGIPRPALELQGRMNMPRYRAVPWPRRI